MQGHKSKGIEKQGKTASPPTPPRAVRLKTLGDLRRFGSKVVNEMRRKRITESEARAYGYLLSIMSGLIQVGSLEIRIEKLEAEQETSR